MSKNKNLQQLATDTDETEVKVLPENVAELDEIAAKLWEKYFYSEPALSKEEKKKVMLEHNEVAAKRNKIGKVKALSIITPSMRAEKRLEATQDSSAPAVETLPRKVKKVTTYAPQSMSGNTLKKVGEAAKDKKKTTIVTTKKEEEKKPKAKKAAAVKKAAPKKAAAKTPATTDRLPGEPKEGSKIWAILELHKAGKSNKEIIEAGHNKSTVNRQVGEYKKRQLLKSK